MAWAYSNPVRIEFGHRAIRQGRRADRAAALRRSSPTASPHFSALAAQARGRCRRARRHHRQHRQQSGFRRSGGVLPPLRRGLDRAGGHRRARRRLDDRCRQGARRERRRFRAREAPSDRESAARRVDIPADHRRPHHVRHRQRSHLMGDGVGCGNGAKYSLAHPRLYPEAAIVDPALTLGGAARADACHRSRCALALRSKASGT